MTHLLIKLFIKDAENIHSHYVREAYGKLGSIVGILLNLLLSLSKISIGLLFSSMAILADGINNLSDAGSSIVTLIGFKLSSKPADASHPYGHARFEYLSGLIVSFIILFLGAELIRSSFLKIIHPETIIYSTLMLFVLIFSIVVKLWLFTFNRYLGKKINSTTMLATATDSLNDAIATSAVLVATLIAKYTGLNLDGYMGIFVGLFVLYSGINLVKDTMNPLLGEAPDPEFIKKVEDKLCSYTSILGFHDLVVHSYGPNRHFASVHVEVPAESNLLECHNMIDTIERECANELDINLVIHLDPIVSEDEKTRNIKANLLKIIDDIHPDLSIHDFRILTGVNNTVILFDITIPISFKISPTNLAQQIDLEMKKLDENYSTIITVDTNYISTSISSV